MVSTTGIELIGERAMRVKEVTLLVCICVPNSSFTPAPAQTTAPPVRKPKGPAPCGCEWDPRGYWKQSDGSEYVRPTNADRSRQYRKRLTDKRRRARQEAQAAAQAARRANLTDEQRRARQEAQAAAQAEVRANLTDEQRRARQEAQAAAQRERREAMPEEKGWEERYAQQRAQQERRAAYADEHERQMQRDATASAMRACRGGVTPLYNALQLPVGQREDQLLYDFHASGSGFGTVNSRRLRTLVPGSALHTRCVDVVREEIRQRGYVTNADQARMTSAYAERQREAAQLSSCGCCGTRDPSMWYSDLKKLAEIPHDHWSRIDPRAFARLLAAPMLRLKLPDGHGGDGNHLPSGLTTSCVYIGTTYIRNELHETALSDITDSYVTKMKDRIASEFAVDASQICMGFFDEEWVLMPRVELHTCF